MDDSLVKKIKDSPFYNEFQEHLISSAEKLNTVVGTQKLSNLEAGELCRAKDMAIDIVEEILSPFINIKSRKEPTDEEILNRKKRFGF